jgi:hypothetical protein
MLKRNGEKTTGASATPNTVDASGDHLTGKGDPGGDTCRREFTTDGSRQVFSNIRFRRSALRAA